MNRHRLANKRIEPMTSSAVTFALHSVAIDALLATPHPHRWVRSL